MTQQYAIEILIGLVLGAYGLIFKGIDKRISNLEEKPACTADACNDRFNKIEQTQSDIGPVLSRFESAISRLEAVIEFLQKDYDARRK